VKPLTIVTGFAGLLPMHWHDSMQFGADCTVLAHGNGVAFSPPLAEGS
jgi:hypothetical protein